MSSLFDETVPAFVHKSLTYDLDKPIAAVRPRAGRTPASGRDDAGMPTEEHRRAGLRDA